MLEFHASSRRHPSPFFDSEETMQLDVALRQLEKAGTAQNRKVYARHGVGANTYGVSWAALGTLAKKIGKDHALALELWKTGNHDARILATMVADPARATEREIEAWVHECDNYAVADAVTGFVSRTRFARDKADAWKDAGKEWIESSGWGLVARLAVPGGDATDAELAAHLATIERDIHRRANRVRYAMNGALIAIGGRSAALRAEALAAAQRIGKVEVDHGQTGCKTPDAAAYIEKMAAYQRRKTANLRTAEKPATSRRAK